MIEDMVVPFFWTIYNKTPGIWLGRFLSLTHAQPSASTPTLDHRCLLKYDLCARGLRIEQKYDLQLRHPEVSPDTSKSQEIPRCFTWV